MKMNHDELTEIAFIFEKEKGRIHSEFENEIIKNSKFNGSSINQLEIQIVSGIQSRLYEKEIERVSAYWALSKRGNKKLIPEFKKWLKLELENKNPIAVLKYSVL